MAEKSKPGVLTSEFYAGVTAAIVTITTGLNTSSEAVQISAMICFTSVVVAYIFSRVFSKG